MVLRFGYVGLYLINDSTWPWRLICAFPLCGIMLTPQWKKYLTSLQITQFVIDLFIVYFASELPTSPAVPHISVINVPQTPRTDLCHLCLKAIFKQHTDSAAYQRLASQYFRFLPNKGDCAGSEPAALFGCGLLTSYLFLFIA